MKKNTTIEWCFFMIHNLQYFRILTEITKVYIQRTKQKYKIKAYPLILKHVDRRLSF